MHWIPGSSAAATARTGARRRPAGRPGSRSARAPRSSGARDASPSRRPSGKTTTVRSTATPGPRGCTSPPGGPRRIQERLHSNAFCGMWGAATVEEGRGLLGRLETAWNWVFADRKGSIGFQQSGLLPRRRPGASGLVPLPGWDPANDWQGFADPADLPRCLDPEDGFFVTANNDLNAFGDGRPPPRRWAPTGPTGSRTCCASDVPWAWPTCRPSRPTSTRPRPRSSSRSCGRCCPTPLRGRRSRAGTAATMRARAARRCSSGSTARCTARCSAGTGSGSARWRISTARPGCS